MIACSGRTTVRVDYGGLLCLDVLNFTGGDTDSYTNGFPTRLVYNVSFPTGPSTRLIPEMNFACYGIMTGYTAALRYRSGHRDPVIQVWRKNTSQPGYYYKTSDDIPINNASCVGGLTEVSREVFHCSLNRMATRVTVQPGDIFGVELPPPGANDDTLLAFARVSRGPTNYVFMRQRLSSPVALFNHNEMVTEMLPQITLEMGLGEYRSSYYHLFI